MGKVRYAQLWGSRGSKYEALVNSDVSATRWGSLDPEPPQYFFVPRTSDFVAEYHAGYDLPRFMPISASGVITARDHLVIGFDEDDLFARIQRFADPTVSDDAIRHLYFRGKGSPKYAEGDTRGWKLANARRELASRGVRKDKIVEILYRPFDVRYIYFDPSMIDWPRPEVSGHMLAGANVALIATRQTRDSWATLATNLIAGHKSMAAFDVNTVFPLYLYEGTQNRSLFDEGDGRRRSPNFAPEFITESQRESERSSSLTALGMG